MNERRKILNDALTSGRKLTEDEAMEAVIRIVFHDDGTPRDFDKPHLRSIVEKHPYFQLLLDEGADEELNQPCLMCNSKDRAKIDGEYSNLYCSSNCYQDARNGKATWYCRSLTGEDN